MFGVFVVVVVVVMSGVFVVVVLVVVSGVFVVATAVSIVLGRPWHLPRNDVLCYRRVPSVRLT